MTVGEGWVQNVGRLRRTFIGLILLIMGVMLTMGTPLIYASPTTDIKPFVIAVPPRGTIKVVVNGHCLNYGLPFPGTTLQPVGLAEDKMRLVIAYSLTHGYYTSNTVEQTQRAIWHFTDKLDVSGETYKLSHDIVVYAEGGAKPLDVDAGRTSLLEAIKQGWVSVSLNDFKDVSNSTYFGQGTLNITNLTEKTQLLYLPYGMVFKDGRRSDVQNMAIFPAEIFQEDKDSQAMKNSACNQMTVKLPANGSTKVLINGHCLNYGLPFPGQSLRSKDLASDVIRNTICYNLAQDYVDRDVWQAQLAVWRQTDKLDKGPQFPLVKEIVAYAESKATPGDTSQDCVLLPQAIEQKLISAQINDFVNISTPAYFGKGTLAVTNLTAKEQTICMPFGMVFKDEKQTGVQDMGIFPDMRPDLKDIEGQQVPEAKLKPPPTLPLTGASTSTGILWTIARMMLGLILLSGGYGLRHLRY